MSNDLSCKINEIKILLYEISKIIEKQDADITESFNEIKLRKI